MNHADLANRCEQPGPDILRFSAATVQGRKGYSWGQVVTTDEKTMRLLCDLWNNRILIGQALRAFSRDPGRD